MKSIWGGFKRLIVYVEMSEQFNKDYEEQWLVSEEISFLQRTGFFFLT